MKVKAGLLDVSRTKGFVKVEEFDGVTTTINLKQLVELKLFLERLKKMGIYRVKIGLEEDAPLLLFFDDKKEMAFALAPEIMVEE